MHSEQNTKEKENGTMKKSILVSAVLSLLICLAGCLINYRSYQSSGSLKWAVRTFGGEITIENGFGWHLVHIYAMTPGQGDTVRLSFSAAGFLLSFLALFAVVHVFSVLIRTLHRHHAQ